MELNISASNKKLAVSEEVFGQEFNHDLVHQVVTAYMAGGRQGSKAQKTRSEVRGGGAKPWRQKGMGKARAGTTRSPIWVGGGRAFAAKPRDYKQKVNRKMYQSALRSIFSRLAKDERLIVLEDFVLEDQKTKSFVSKLNELQLKNVLMIFDAVDENVHLASRNVPHVNVIDLQMMDPVQLLKYEQVAITVSALKQLEEKLA